MSASHPSAPSDDPSRRLHAARSGSREALGQLLESQRATLLRIAARELPVELQGKASDEDLVQQTFLEGVRDFARFQGTTEAELRSWLQRILRNNVSNVTRDFLGAAKRQVRREVSLSDLSAEALDQALGQEGAAPIPLAVDRERQEQVHRVLEDLSEEQREVLRLRYFHGLSFQAIAQRLGRSPKAIRKSVQRALAGLQAFRDRLA